MMSMCRVFSCVVGRGCLPWPVRSQGKTLLAFVLLHSIFQGQICLIEVKFTCAVRSVTWLGGFNTGIRKLSGGAPVSNVGFAGWAQCCPDPFTGTPSHSMKGHMHWEGTHACPDQILNRKSVSWREQSRVRTADSTTTWQLRWGIETPSNQDCQKS